MTSIIKVNNIQNSSGTAAVSIDGSSNVTFPQNATISGNTTITGTTTATGKITSTAGITFGSDTAASNVLDDYEEGTWTPTVDSGTVAIQANSSRYIKVGNLVTVYTRISTFSDNTSGTSVMVKSLPFTISSDNPDANIGNAWGQAMGNHRSIFFFSTVNSTQTLGYYGASGSGFNQVIHSDLTSSTDMLIKLTYITA